MVRDAEAHAAEDLQMKKLAESRNEGDALVHSTRKTLAEHGDKLDSGEKEKIEAAIKTLDEALKGNDKSAIDAGIAALSGAAQKFGEKMYSAGQAQQPENTAASAESNGSDRSRTAENDDVVDADFKEVKK
jgi:molecular chaperone DnaK